MPLGALAGSLLFVLAGPGIELGLGPYVLTGFEVGDGLPAALQPVGWVLLALGVALLVAAYERFIREGRGTPSPLAPPRTLVRGGVYGILRHPMYVGSTIAIVGEALILRAPILLVAAAVFAAAMALLVRHREGPQLRQRFD